MQNFLEYLVTVLYQQLNASNFVCYELTVTNNRHFDCGTYLLFYWVIETDLPKTEAREFWLFMKIVFMWNGGRWEKYKQKWSKEGQKLSYVAMWMLVFWAIACPYCDRNKLSDSSGTTAPSGAGPPHYRGFTITLIHTTPGRTPLDEWSARRRDLYLTTHNTHNRQSSMPPAGFEPTNSAPDQLQTHDLHRAATGLNILGYVWEISANITNG
jgi:hypothetical protein